MIQQQIEAGVDLVTDGQIRWDDEITYFARGLENVSLNGLFRYFDTNTYFRQPVVQGGVAWRSPVTVDDYRFAADSSTKPVKAVLPAPFTLAALSIDEHYGERFESLVMDYAAAVNAEARALAQAGAPVIQFNDPVLTRRKQDVSLACRAIAAAAEGVTATTQVSYYYGDVDGILGALVECPVDVIALDFIMGPANYEALKAVSLGDKTICAGIMDARNTKLESEEELLDRLGRVNEAVATERLQVSPNMGLEFLPRERR